MEEYKLFKSDFGNNSTMYIIRMRDNVFIPFSDENTDYKEYLQWLAEGNELLPPDEPTANNG
jgi:hypothetical protein